MLYRKLPRAVGRCMMSGRQPSCCSSPLVSSLQEYAFDAQLHHSKSKPELFVFWSQCAVLCSLAVSASVILHVLAGLGERWTGIGAWQWAASTLASRTMHLPFDAAGQ